jgi:uncharacterized SAM-binding protein YcdF (DUF218 family)
VKLVCLAILGAVGCVDLRDTLLPYRPHPADIDAVLAMPRRAQYDTAIVLGCPANPDGSPSLCQQCRIDSAAREYQRGRFGKLILSGAGAHTPAVEADVMADLAAAHGVPANALLRERRALTTWQNLRYATAMMRKAHLDTALVISTADHLPRARRIAQFYGLDDAHAGYLACDRNPIDQ